jgi:hypothetical protein
VLGILFGVGCYLAMVMVVFVVVALVEIGSVGVSSI